MGGEAESALLPFTHKSKSEERNFDICGSREIRILHDPQVPRPTRVVAKIMTLTFDKNVKYVMTINCIDYDIDCNIVT